MHGFVPLTASPQHRRQDPARRIHLFADACGLSQAQPQQPVPMLPRRASAMHAFPAGQAATGTPPRTRLWQQGHRDAWRAGTEYITQTAAQWQQALLGQRAQSNVGRTPLGPGRPCLPFWRSPQPSQPTNITLLPW